MRIVELVKMRIRRSPVEGSGDALRITNEPAESAEENLDYSQETDFFIGRMTAKMASMKKYPLAQRANDLPARGLLRRIFKSAASALLLAFPGILLYGQIAPITQGEARARTTVVIFPARPLPDGEWSALLNAVQTIAIAEKIEGANEAEFVRGDTMQPGLSVDRAVVVYLHGSCDLEPLARRTAYSVRLGWVIRENGVRNNGGPEAGQIDPYIHVDCTRIGEVLGAQARGLDKEARDRMMAGAMARVLVHEWIHIARQTAEHGWNGITKSSFSEADLLGETETHVARR